MRVLISGAGIAGPTLAHFLWCAGAQVTLVEKATQMLAQGQNIDVHGTALHIVHKMGLVEELRKHNTTEKGTCFVDEQGRSYASFPLVGSLGSATSEFEILRGDLAELLYQATRDRLGINYRFGTTVTQVLENGQDKVWVKLSNGEQEEYDVLVAADGQWSRIRKEVFGAEAVQVVDKGCYAIYATVPREKQDDDYWQIYHALGSRIVATRPDNHGTLRAMLTIMPLTESQKQAWQQASRSHDRTLQLNLVKSEFGDLGWKTPRLLKGMETADDFYFQAVQQIRLSKWHKNRVICLGDTAYAPSPFTGMGTSLAINGAYLLAGHLSQLEHGRHPSVAFDAYENEFRPFVQEIQGIPWFVPGIAHPQYAWSRWLFQRCIATLAYVLKIPWLVRKYGPKDKKVIDGVADELDAPFPTFSAFEQAPSAKPHVDTK